MPILWFVLYGTTPSPSCQMDSENSARDYDAGGPRESASRLMVRQRTDRLA